MIAKPSEFGGLFLYRRLVVVGANGAGKTWFANHLAAILRLPVTHNDALALTTNWRYCSAPEIASARDMIITQDRWIYEGGPSILTEKTLHRAEALIWLDPPRRLRLSGVLRRTLIFMGRQRPEHPPGNREWPGLRQTRFLFKTWRHDTVTREAIAGRLANAQRPCFRFVTPSETTAFLDQIRKLSDDKTL